MTILVTGACGYIGKHIIVELAKLYHVIGIDINIPENMQETLCKIALCNKITLFKCDIKNYDLINTLFKVYDITHVIHLAGYKSIPESIINPDKYKDNVEMTKVLLSVMKKHNCKNIIFSSSATVYGNPQYLPIDEKHPLNPINPYGQSKLDCEKLIQKHYIQQIGNATIFRYFNPIGYHNSGLLTDDLSINCSNLIPSICKAIKNKDIINIYGTDYSTRDGTAARDYIHINDIVQAHILAVQSSTIGCHIYNLSTNQSSTVQEIITIFNNLLQVTLPISYQDRRDGDVDELYADNTLVKEELKWFPKNSLEKMIKSCLL